MVESKKLDTTRARTKQNEPAAKKAVAKKPAAKKPASISLEKAIPELEREVKRIAELESDPMLRAILAERIILTADEIADSIENGFLEGKVIYDNNGAPDPAQSSIAANELPRFLDFIRRASEETKVLYLEQHNIEGCPASFDLGYWSAVARDVGGVHDWCFWSGLKTLTPIKASCLLVELDPDNYANIKTFNTPQIVKLVKYIDHLAYHAKTDNDGNKLSPAEWIEWAQSKGYAVPEKFIKAVDQFEKQKPKTSTVKQSYTVVPVVTAEHETTKDEPPKMKRAALIAMLDKEGFDKVADKFRRSHPNDNGLHDAAKHKDHNYWYVDKARAWFVQEQGEPNIAKKPDDTIQNKKMEDYWPPAK